MKKFTDKAEKVVAENIVNAKQLKEILNQKTADLVRKSDHLMNKADHKAERMVVRAKGKAQKVISKV